jgi:tripartite-type tricarboxylate transporter receptor subunit TctC
MMKKSSVLCVLIIGTIFFLNASVSFGQAYPNRPIKLIVPFAPGGGTDIIARAITPRLSEALGQQVIVDNRPGAGTIIGAEKAARSAPDGYTLFMGISGTMAINPSLYSKFPYDPVKDFSPIVMVGIGPNILVVHPSLPVKSVKELIAYAKANPNKLSYASSGTGGAPHLAGELFKSMAELDIVHVPYKGAGPATIDLLGGSVQLMFAGMGAALPHIKAGKLRPLAVADSKRSKILPDVPAMSEFLKGFEAPTWFAVFAPAGTPKEIITLLHSQISKVVAREDVERQMLSLGYEPLTSTPEELGSHVKNEIAKWAKVIQNAGIKTENVESAK